MKAGDSASDAPLSQSGGGTVLIAGLGFVGEALAQHLLTQGHQPVGLRRTSSEAAYPIVSADLCEPASLVSLPQGLNAVVFCASAGGRTEDAYRRTYVQGLKNLMHAVATHERPPTRLVFVSSTAVYAQTDGGVVTEDSPTEPSQFSGQVMLEAEAVAATFPGAGISVRASGIYGPGRRRFVASVENGTAVWSAETPVYTNRIHRDDLARAISHVLHLKAPEQLYLASDTDPASRETVIRWLSQRLQVPMPPEANGASSTTEGSKASRGGYNKRCDSTRLVQSGFQFSYPSFKEGYGEMIELERQA